MPQGIRHSDEFRKKVLDDVAGGLSIAQACKKYKIANSIVYNWRRQAEGHAPARRVKVKDDRTLKVRTAYTFLKAALDEWGSVKSHHMASVALIELKEVL